jgi:hypothetical protein
MDCPALGAGPAAMLTTYLRITAGGVTVANPFTAHALRGLEIVPGPGQLVSSVVVRSDGTDAGYDQCGDAIYVVPAGGRVQLVDINGGWAGGSQRGLYVDGNVDGLDLYGLNLVNNAVAGAVFGNALNVWMRGGRVTGNGVGLRHLAGSHARLRDVRIGAVAGVANGTDRILDPGALDDAQGCMIGGPG